MKHLFLLLLLFSACSLSVAAQSVPNSLQSTKRGFTENKGQICDQHLQQRSDVAYAAFDGHLSLFIKQTGVEYQLYRFGDKTPQSETPTAKADASEGIANTACKLKVNWLNANKKPGIRGRGALPGFSNYYLPQCPAGALHVRSFSELEMTNVYNGIHLRWYFSGEHIKYDFIVSPGANYKQICLQYEGALSLSTDKDNNLLIQTPLGYILEEAPLVKQGNTVLAASWIIDGHTASFKINGLNPAQSFTIDPLAREWGTLYGGHVPDYFEACTTDKFGNAYASGYSGSFTNTALSSVGAHQTTIAGVYDAWLVKFSSNGTRLWATFYGAANSEDNTSCVCDTVGNVYLCGTTSPLGSTLLATPGSHQPVGGGGSDGFLVKFNSAGVRQWGTYYGGSGSETMKACTTDSNCNVYISGNTSSTASIASPGAHQTSRNGTSDAFLAKFDASGNRLWATYYGDTGNEQPATCDTDMAGNVFLVGSTNAGTLNTISTPGVYQTAFVSITDAYLVKFNANGQRLWGSFCGGNGIENVNGCATDAAGNIYFCGEATSSSTMPIVTTGAHQTTHGGNTSDGFLVKFDPNGQRLWGTYYGSVNNDVAEGCATDQNGNVYLTGIVIGSGSAANAIATATSYQPTYGGGSADAFLAMFNSSGLRQWGSYYGGFGVERALACTTSSLGELYICGFSSGSGNPSVASSNGHQTVNGGQEDGFLAKFYECAVPTASNTTPPSQLSICYNTQTTLTAAGTGTISWYTAPSVTGYFASGNTIVTPALLTSTVYYVDNTTCAPSGTRIAIQVIVNPLPTLFLSGTSNSVCAGSVVTIGASGAISYTWTPSIYSGSSFTVAPGTNIFFTVAGTNGFGCVNTKSGLLYVTPLPVVTAAASPPQICAGESVLLQASGASAYNWSTGGTQSSEVVYPGSNAIYTVSGTSAAGCTNTTTVAVSVDECLSVSHPTLQAPYFRVFPNPSHGSISIEATTSLKAIRISDVTGKIIHEEELTPGRQKASVGALATGCYLVSITDKNNHVYHQRLIVD